MKRRLNKLGAGSTLFAAIMVFVVALILVIYIMAIPPADRQALLEGNQKPTYGDFNSGTATLQNLGIESDFFFKGPGFVDEVDSEGGEEHDLPAVNLRTRVNSVILLEDPAFFVKESIGTSVTRKIPFSIEDFDSIDDIKYTFLAKKSKGELLITLNGYTLFQGDMDELNFPPRKISAYMLKENNLLEFTVKDIGFLFWRTNEYIINDFVIFGDKTETSSQNSFVTFEVGNSEYRFMKGAKLKFYPDCKQQTVGNLEISLNDRVIMNQIPDCNILNIYDVPKASLLEGYNTLSFGTTKDTYLIDRIQVVTDLKDNDDLIYYFDLDSSLFNVVEDERSVCGEFDGICPDGCSEDDDKDCCFVEYSGEGYWCDVLTANANDRCVGRVDSSNKALCPSIYEDEAGRPADVSEDVCGDDTDGVCPSGCSEYYDADCCLELDNFWCDDLTTIGVAGVCMKSVTNDQCAFCPSGYEGDRYDPECEYDSRNLIEDDASLKSYYDVDLTLKFVDDDARKRGRLKVNGYETSFSTFQDEVTINIDRFVEEESNYLQILPDNSFHLVSISVNVEDN